MIEAATTLQDPPRGRTTAISGWREKMIHFNPRTTAIPLHGFVRFAILCDLRLCVQINRIARQRIQRSTGIRLRAELCDDKSNVDATTDEPEDLAVPHQRRL